VTGQAVLLGRRVVGFAMVPALSVLSPLLVLPLISHRFGPTGWSAVSIGQGTGGALSVVVGLSWPTVGAHLVASAGNAPARLQLYVDSMVSRLVVLAGLAPLGMLASALLAHDHRWAAALCALGLTLNGLTVFWYYVGVGTPRPLVVNEALPRLVAAGATVALLLAGADLWVFGALLVVSGAASAGLNYVTIMGGRPRRVTRVRSFPAVMRGVVAQHGVGTASRVMYGVYNTASVSIVALVAPSAVAGYAAIDRLWRTAFNGVTALPQGFAAWVSGGLPSARGRAARAAAAMAGLAVTAFAGLWLIFPVGMRLLFAGRATWTPTERLLAATVLAVCFLGQALGLVTAVPLGGESAVYLSNATAACLGVPLILVLARRHSVAGGLTAVLVAESAVVVVLLTWWALRRRSRVRAPAASRPGDEPLVTVPRN
jgi:O-antigen/teichoic acid export membrane protein